MKWPWRADGYVQKSCVKWGLSSMVMRTLGLFVEKIYASEGELALIGECQLSGEWKE